MKKTIFKPSDFSTIRPLKRLGFTLAEVLITLGIIGIVAALTIPVLMQNIQNNQFKQAWKKEYSVLSQAAQQYLQDNSTTFQGVSNYANIFKDYFHVVKYCPTHASAEGCWVPSGQNYYLQQLNCGGNTNIAGVPDNCPNQDLGAPQGLVLADGTAISAWATSPASCNEWEGYCGWILVDVNGSTKPNTVGKDIFGVWVMPNKLVPIGYQGDSHYGNSCTNSGYGCSATYLYGN